MKKTLSILFSLTLLSMLVGTTVFAEESGLALRTISSKATVLFEQASLEPNPINPTKPDLPVEEIELDEEHPGSSGALRFDRVPKLDFGTAKIKGETVIQKVKEDNFTIKGGETFYSAPTVLITDVRDAYTGWQAEVSMSEFVNTTDGEDKLIGAEIAFNNAYIQGYSGIKDDSYKPELTFSSQPLVLTQASAPFANAENDKGMGVWGVSFYDEPSATGYPEMNTTGKAKALNAITLTIPATSNKTAEATYQAELTWTLKQEASIAATN